MRVLLAGWFSFEGMGATAGDLMVRDLACEWLSRAGCPYDVALGVPFDGGVDWRSINPDAYTHICFVCGPFGNVRPLTDFLSRFEHCHLIGLDLSMVDGWNPFDVLFERDSSTLCCPDVAMLAPVKQVPVVGVILCDHVSEYGDRSQHDAAHDAIQRLIQRRELAAVRIDTRLDRNSTGLRTAAEIENMISRMDIVVTTRLHGTVLAIKSGVPPVVIDPIVGLGKISAQVRALGWRVALDMTTLNDRSLETAFDYCLTPQARTEAVACRNRAIGQLNRVQENFILELTRLREATSTKAKSAAAAGL